MNLQLLTGISETVKEIKGALLKNSLSSMKEKRGVWHGNAYIGI